MKWAEAVLVIWILCLSINKLHSQFHRLVSKPIFSEVGNGKLYRCEFNATVNCLWRSNNATISLRQYHYKYVSGNGNNTIDCSIRGPTNARQLTDAECVGQHYGSNITTKINDSVQLFCNLTGEDKCSWKRNNIVLNIEGNYQYIDKAKLRVCSIQINNVVKKDIATWECTNRGTDTIIGSDKTFVYHLNKSKSQKTFNKTGTDNSEDQNNPISTTAIEANYKIATTSTWSADPQNKDEINSIVSVVAICLSAICTVLIFLLGVSIYLCRRQKSEKKKSSMPDAIPSPTFVSYATVDDIGERTIDEPAYENVPQQVQENSPPAEEFVPTNPPLNNDNDDFKSTEVIYTQVVISKKTFNKPLTPNEKPNEDLEDVTYATIIHRRFSQDISKLAN